jgi:hypothetical protein
MRDGGVFVINNENAKKNEKNYYVLSVAL